MVYFSVRASHVLLDILPSTTKYMPGTTTVDPLLGNSDNESILRTYYVVVYRYYFTASFTAVGGEMNKSWIRVSCPSVDIDNSYHSIAIVCCLDTWLGFVMRDGVYTLGCAVIFPRTSFGKLTCFSDASCTCNVYIVHSVRRRICRRTESRMKCSWLSNVGLDGAPHAGNSRGNKTLR